jgi:hypothetical protein
VPSFQENSGELVTASRLSAGGSLLTTLTTKLLLTSNGYDSNVLKPCAEENFSVNTIDARSKH